MHQLGEQEKAEQPSEGASPGSLWAFSQDDAVSVHTNPRSERTKVREIRRRTELRAKKSLGQHFLVDREVLQETYRLAQTFASRYDLRALVELGPGWGALTQYLVQVGPACTLIEVDPEACQVLQERFSLEELETSQISPTDQVNHTAYTNHTDCANHNEGWSWKKDQLTLLEADALTFPWESFCEKQGCPEGKGLGFFSNIPYQITKEVWERAFLFLPRAPMGLLMQKEAADRLLAGPGSKEYGPLSALSAGLFAKRKLRNVGPGAFDPPPKVQSTLVALDPLDPEDSAYRKKLEILRLNLAERQAFYRFLQEVFGQRRKKVRNCLDPERMSEISLEIRPLTESRAEALNVEDLFQIFWNLRCKMKG